MSEQDRLISVMIADDEPGMRLILRKAIEASGGFAVAAEAVAQHEARFIPALEHAHRVLVDLAAADVREDRYVVVFFRHRACPSRRANVVDLFLSYFLSKCDIPCHKRRFFLFICKGAPCGRVGESDVCAGLNGVCAGFSRAGSFLFDHINYRLLLTQQPDYWYNLFDCILRSTKWKKF